MNFLSAHYEPEDEWYGKLTVSVSTSGFAGRGSAWFATEELREFGKALLGYPLSSEGPPFIVGGSGGEPGAPEQVHLSLLVEPHDRRGTVRLAVRLATEVWNSVTEDLACDTTVRFLIAYGDLGRFGPAFLDMIEGGASEARLETPPF